MKLTVLYAKDTGHALAAVTRVALPEADAGAEDDAVSPEVRALAGEALPVRGFFDASGTTTKPDPAVFSIPAEDLAAVTVDGEDHQLLAPRDYVVLEEDKKLQPADPTTVPTVTPTNGNRTLAVTLADDAPKDLVLVVYLQPQGGAAGPAQRLQTAFKSGTATRKTVNLTVAVALDGEYGVLVLLEGRAPGMWRLSV